MVILLSPTKKQQTHEECSPTLSTPRFISEANELATYLATLSTHELSQRMKISDALTHNVAHYFAQWPQGPKVSALSLYTGEAFSALDPFSLSPSTLQNAQNSLRIISGLYGLLRPLDATSPHRLEIAYKFEKYPSLYTFWKEKITSALVADIATHHHSALVNLASKEYTKAIDFKQIPVPVITPLFLEYKGDTLKTVAIFAKRARGAAARFLIQNSSHSVDILKEFTYEGYQYDPTKSTATQWYFIKGEPHVL